MPETTAPTQFRDAKAKLHGERLQLLENAQRSWFADIPSGTTLETVTQPYFWAHHARTIRPDDMIRARCEDGSWAADLWVMFVSPAEVKVAVYHHKKLDADTGDIVPSDLHEVAWKGPGLKFCVVHKKTGAIVRDRLYPKSEAIAFLRSHLRQMAS